MRVFPGAIFYAHNGQGTVDRYDVVKLEWATQPRQQSKAYIRRSNKPPKYHAAPELETSVTQIEKWAEKFIALESGGMLVLELGRLYSFLSLSLSLSLSSLSLSLSLSRSLSKGLTYFCHRVGKDIYGVAWVCEGKEKRLAGISLLSDSIYGIL